MGFNRFALGFNGFQRGWMKFIGFSMEFWWIVFHLGWISIDFISFLLEIDFNGCSMDLNGCHLISIDFNGCQWISLDFQWISNGFPMDFQWIFQWISNGFPMDFNGCERIWLNVNWNSMFLFLINFNGFHYIFSIFQLNSNEFQSTLGPALRTVASPLSRSCNGRNSGSRETHVSNKTGNNIRHVQGWDLVYAPQPR